MIARVCLGCRRLISRGSRCPDCTRKREAERRAARGTTAERGYNAAWQRLSTRQRREVPWCQLRYPGCERVAVDVDHVIPLRAGGTSTRDNAASTCRPCHRIKTALDQERYP